MQADGLQWLFAVQADELIDLGVNRSAGLGGADRDGHDHLLRPGAPQRPKRCPHRRAGCEAVVDEDHLTAIDFERWQTSPKRALLSPSFQLFAIASLFSASRACT